jgi:catechol 2,3-dioxygenase-like lactoylglutathione lyase family enzyme
MPLAHVSLPVSSLSASTAFYTTLLAPLGYGIYLSLEETVGMGPKYGAPDFWLHHCPTQKEGEKAGGGVSKTHVCFNASSQKQVKAFYEAGL